MKDKIIPVILSVIFLVSVQFGYAETEFSFEFGSKGTANDEFDNPTDLIVDKNGKKIYVVDNANNRIGVFEDDKDFEFNYGSFCNIASIGDCHDREDGADADGDGQFNAPFSITRDARGQFYVVDSDNQRVQIFDDDGKFKSKFGSSDRSADDYLGSASGIAVQESTKEILVSNIESDSISIFNADGDFLFKFDSFDGRDDFKNPTNMVIDNSEQMLYVSDSGNDRIVIFELVTGTTCPSGTEEVVDGICFVEKFGSSGSGDGEFDDPTGLAYDENNDLLYVADSDNDRIQIFDMAGGDVCPSGTEKIVDGICFVEKFGSSGSGDGEFDDPNGLAYDENNDLLYVADSDNDRIQALSISTEPASLLPNRPSGLEASPGSPTSIILSWTEPDQNEAVPEITGYKIEFKVGSGKYITISENTESKTTSFIHDGLDSGERYSYRVYSINSEGESATFSQDTAKPQHTTKPTALVATPIGPNQVKLFWLPPSETYGQNIAGYVIKREIVTGVYDEIGNTNSDTRSFVVSNLSTDKTYTFAVSAKIGAFGSSEESSTASATPREDSVNVIDDPITSTTAKIAKPSPPIKLSVAVVSSTQNNLTWNAPVKDGNTSVTGYKIEVKRNNSSYITLVSNTESTARTYSHDNLVTDSKYTYKVSAINAVGVSEPSNEFSATPKSIQVNLSPLGMLTIDEGKRLSFTAKLEADSVKDVVFSLDKNPPAGAKITPNTGVFSWTPTGSDGGKTYSLVIVAKKDGLSDRETITITVNDVKVSPPTPKPELPAAPEELGIASFVDESKDPQSYVDRYDHEPGYKEWFDKNYAEYDSIYQAVGLDEPPQVPAPFVDESEDPRFYVDRYDNEPAYKAWFDENFSEYDSIYHAVGLDEPETEPVTDGPAADDPVADDSAADDPVAKEPVVEEKKFGICGTGTKLVDGVCAAVKLPAVKPWWQFW